MTSPALAPRHRRVFRAVGATVAPRSGELNPAQWDEAMEIVETALADRPPSIRRRVRLFLAAVQWLPLLRWARPFTALDAARRTRFLGALQDAPVLLLRQGFWGVRTLALMACYGLPDVRRSIGYRAHPRGWAAEEVRRGEGSGADLEPDVGVQL